MLAGGEDPRYIARRLVRFASEDIGLADPQALVQALAAWEAYERLGSPEGDLALPRSSLYLGTAPKSNAAYTATRRRRPRGARDRQPDAARPYPERADQADEDLGYGAGYDYDHDAEDAFSGQNYFPDGMDRARLLPPARPRLRARARPPPGPLGRAAGAADHERQQRAVTEDEADIRLDRWLRRHFPAVTQGAIQKLCRTGQLRVDGKRAEAATRLAPGQSVRVPPLPASSRAPKPRPEFDPASAQELEGMVLYRDDAAHRARQARRPADAGRPGDHAASRRHAAGAAVRHASTARAWCTASTATRPACLSWRARRAWRPSSPPRSAAATVEKTYWAIVAGRPVPVEGRIEPPLVRIDGFRGERAAVARPYDEDAARSITDYRTLDHAAQKLAWLELRPLTGRTHQLRVHCVSIGAPILGDAPYGVEKEGRNSALVDGLTDQLQLHARRLVLPHPSGGRLAVEAPLPRHIADTFRDLGFTAPPAAEPLRR